MKPHVIALKAAGSLLTACAVGATAVLNAAEISLESAKNAAQAWIDLGYSMDCLRGKSAAEGETLESDGAKMHVVSLGGGGFMVMGADDLVQPVIAFSPNGEANAHDTKSPLWKILKADLAMRVRAGEAVSADESAVQPRIPLLRGATSSSRTETQRLWDRLLGGGVTATKSRLRLLSSTPDPVEAVFDVRVAPLVKSRWGQENNSIYFNKGAPCYNYNTPNKYPCGCVATALAQIMRFHRFPLSVPNVRTKNCQVGTASMSMTMMDGDYDYDNMPLVPEAYSGVSWYEGGATEAQRQAIGKLTYNCSVAMQTWWDEYESSSGGAGAASVLTGDIGYANAVVCACETDLADAGFRNRIICSNLDAGFPVLLGIVRHEVIADGYGYSGETLYTHINLGWSGEDNVWYALPSIATSDGSFSSEFVESVIYNIFPSSSGEIVSGRVLDDNGNPVVGADVTIIPDGSTATDLAVCATTGDAGIFSFVVPGGKSYVVNAVGYGITATMKVETGKSVSSRVTLKTGYCDVANPSAHVACGNVWGCDIVLDGLKSVALPAIEPCGGEVFPATNVTISCTTEGATVRYTTDGSEPTEESDVYSGPFEVASDMMIKARAFKYGWNPSSVVVAFFDYDEFKGAPRGGFYGKPIEISGEEGSTNLQSTAKFALEDDEPWHNEYYAEDRTCWYRWESPGSGTMTFRTCSFGVNPDTGRNAYFLSPVAVYEESESMPNSSSEQVAMNYEWDTNTHTTAVSFTVRPGAVYRIVGVISYPYDIPLTLTWSGDLEEPSEIVWTVAFDANGGVLSGEATRSVPHGSFLGELPDAMKDGYRFLGWCTEKVGGWKVSSNFTVEDDIVLHAQWERLNPFSEAGLGSEYRLPGGVLQMDLSSLLASVAKKGWKIAVTGLPTGLKFDAAKNTFSGIATKEGVFTVTFTATQGKTKEIATAMFEVVFPTLTLDIAACGEDASATNKAKVVGGGKYPMGAKVTLKATPDKGKVFAGWFDADGNPLAGAADYRTASFPYVATDADVTLTAKFASDAEDNASLKVTVSDATTATDGAYELNLGACVESLSIPKLAVKGLPTGLKFDTKTLKITGKATKPGVYPAKVEATNTSVKKATDASTGEFKLTVPNFTTEMFAAAGLDTDGKYVLAAGVLPDALANVVNAVAAKGWTLKIDGLPAGVKYDAKKNVFSGIATKEGFFTVTFTATQGKTKEIATATFEVVFPTLAIYIAAYGEDTSATNKAKVVGGGKYPMGAKVTLKATPDKGKVFAGWFDADGNPLAGAADYRTASFPYVATDADVTLTAKFASDAEDNASLKVTVSDATTATDGAYELNLGACVESLSIPKLAVKGLPTGLKFDTKTLKITGKATKPGVYPAKVEATNTSVKKATDASTGEFKLTVPNFTCAALPNLKPETGAYGTNFVGVAFDPALVDCTPAGGWTVKVAGLPAGLKYDAKTGKVTGVSTAKVGSYTVTFTATKGKEKQVATITLNVEALPVWAVGTFDGPVNGGGIVQTLTVGANGKISGKVLDGGSTWALSAVSFDSYDAGIDAYLATVIGKNGKLLATNFVAFTEGADGTGVASCDEWTAYQNLWKRTDTKASMPVFKTNIDVALDNSLKLTFKKDGVVAFAGTVDGAKVSGSSQLVWNGEVWSVTLYAPPTKTFDGYCETFDVMLTIDETNVVTDVSLVWNGASFTLPE